MDEPQKELADLTSDPVLQVALNQIVTALKHNFTISTRRNEIPRSITDHDIARHILPELESLALSSVERVFRAQQAE